MSNAIRLTNKTAKALRKSAQRMRTLHFACAVVFSVAMAALAVYLGLKWLPAVPLMVAMTVMIDALIVVRGRSAYLSLVGQAICTEAAAREIRAGQSESQRREKAITDLINAKADAQLAGKESKAPAKDVQPFFEPEQEQEPDEDEMQGERAYAQEEAMPRRRRRRDGLKLIRGEQAK